MKERQLTARALTTGAVLGALLAPCNVYAGLKIGWSFNMSVSAALLSYGFWGTLHRHRLAGRWGLLENNINQTSASAAASIAGAGLVAPIPALAILTGAELGFGALVFWTATVSFVGVVVAIGLRHQLIDVSRLSFPSGVATAHTVKEMYAKGSEAALRVRTLLAVGGAAAGLRVFQTLVAPIPAWRFTGGATAFGAPLAKLGWVLEPSLLMFGFGGIIGIRAGTSLLLGACVAWGLLSPLVLAAGWVEIGAAEQGSWFGPLVEWMLWPGVALMVASSLTSFGLSVPSMWRGAPSEEPSAEGAASAESGSALDEVPRRAFWVALLAVIVLATFAQVQLFGIGWVMAGSAVLLTFVLAVVAGRVSGETGITPIGAMGKVTQLTFGFAGAGDATTNLMTANVTGGAASQCADMLHDLKTGRLLGASPRKQAMAQFAGVLAGSVGGSAAYLLLVPSPRTELLTDEWPAPAVRTWKAVAELFAHGFESAPEASVEAMLVGGAVGVLLAALERWLPNVARRWVPSPASVGLAFVIPASFCLSMFLGAAVAELARRRRPSLSARFGIIVAAGLVAGESLGGVAAAFVGILSRW